MSDPLRIKRNDTRPIRATLKDASGVVPLTDAQTVKFSMRRRGEQTNKVTLASAIVLSPATAGRVEWSPQPADVNADGVYDAEWEVVWADGTRQTFPDGDYAEIVILPDLA